MRDDAAQEELYEQINTGTDYEGQSHARIVFKNKPRNLCERCKSGHLFSRTYKSELTVFCKDIEKYVPADVEECNQYYPIGRVSLWDLAKMATLIEKPKNDGGHYL